MRVRRTRREGQRGFTLIELLVLIAGLGGAAVFIGQDLADAYRLAAISNEQSLLEITMRQVTDYLRQPYDSGAPTLPPPGLTGEQYAFCAASSTSSSAPANSYSVPASVGSPSTHVTIPAGGPIKTWSIQVVNGQSASRTDSTTGMTTSPPPFEDCTTSTFNPPGPCAAAHTCDWGVQQLVVTLTLNDARSLTRTIYKSEAV